METVDTIVVSAPTSLLTSGLATGVTMFILNSRKEKHEFYRRKLEKLFVDVQICGKNLNDSLNAYINQAKQAEEIRQEIDQRDRKNPALRRCKMSVLLYFPGILSKFTEFEKAHGAAIAALGEKPEVEKCLNDFRVKQEKLENGLSGEAKAVGGALGPWGRSYGHFLTPRPSGQFRATESDR